VTVIENLRRMRRGLRHAAAKAEKISPQRPSADDQPPAQSTSVGTELKSLLERFGITQSDGCRCTHIAAEMDRRGAAWCEENLDQLAAQMMLEARRRQWSLLRLTSALGLGGVTEAVVKQAGKWLILEAIRRTRGIVGPATPSDGDGEAS